MTKFVPLNIPKFAQASSEAIEVGSIDRRRRSFEHADPPHLPRVLRLRGERRGEQRGSTSEECAPIHRSITWSARSRSDRGIVRPRALAVLRLMTSS